MSPSIASSRFRMRSSASPLQQRLVEALAEKLIVVPEDGSLSSRPLELSLRPPLPVRSRFYVYQATSHPSERDKDAWKIQVTVGDRGTGARNRFDWSEGFMVFLVGWVPDYRVWVVYDARAQEGESGFPYSKSCYVDRTAILEAGVDGLAETITRLKSPARTERIFVCTSARLGEALLRRFRLHLGLEADD